MVWVWHVLLSFVVIFFKFFFSCSLQTIPLNCFFFTPFLPCKRQNNSRNFISICFPFRLLCILELLPVSTLFLLLLLLFLSLFIDLNLHSAPFLPFLLSFHGFSLCPSLDNRKKYHHDDSSNLRHRESIRIHILHCMLVIDCPQKDSKVRVYKRQLTGLLWLFLIWYSANWETIEAGQSLTSRITRYTIVIQRF